VIHFEKTGSDPPLVPLSAEDDPLLLEGTMGLTALDLRPEMDLKAALGGCGSRPHTPNPVISGGNNNNTAWHSCRKLIYVQRSAQKGFAVGFWPLPESFWPDVNAGALPPRSAHPTLKFTCTNQEPMIIDNLPFDKYELEPSPLTLFILGRKQPNYCWQVFIQGSTKNGDTGHPFGYLKVRFKSRDVLHAVSDAFLPFCFGIATSLEFRPSIGFL
jgi:integrator complex subunit 6